MKIELCQLLSDFVKEVTSVFYLWMMWHIIQLLLFVLQVNPQTLFSYRVNVSIQFKRVGYISMF